MPLTIEEFLKAKIEIHERDCGDLGIVCFRVIGGDELQKWTDAFGEDDPRHAQRFAASCVVDAKGKRAFEDDNLDEFLTYPLHRIIAVTTEALVVNGLASEELEEMEKKSGAETNGEHG